MRKVLSTKDRDGKTIYQVWEGPNGSKDSELRSSGRCIATGFADKAKAEEEMKKPDPIEEPKQ